MPARARRRGPGRARRRRSGSAAPPRPRRRRVGAAGAVARAGYRHGASYVDVYYADTHVKRALIERGPDAALTHTPAWLLTRVHELNAKRGALVAITGDPEPELLSDLDGERVGKARMLELARANSKQINELLANWTIVSYPTAGWA